jgi:hypothetical protein
MTLERQHTGYTKLYALWDDSVGVKRVQDATLNTKDYGIVSEHGLFGSPEWWSAIEKGELTVYTVRGVICDLVMESMNDWPVFKILTDAGSVTKSITREHLPLRADDHYQIGRNVIWQYVHVRHKKRMIATLPLLSEHTVSIWVADTEILFRPVGEEELSLIRALNFAAFPPRLPEQPIFYPVCNFRYAEEIASKWNAPGGRGYVTRFEVAKSFLTRYEKHQVGGKEHVEYWIPAEELEAFNRSIVGKIRVVKSFSGESPTTTNH